MSKLSRIRIFLSLVASIASLAAMAQSAQVPKLLLNISVEGLDAEYLDILRRQFGQGGFNRLFDQAAVVAKADYGTSLDAAAATAAINTGAAPSATGIPGKYIYDRDALRTKHIYDDNTALGNFTSSTYSPKALRVSNISDEARIASGGTNVVYSVAVDPAVALGMAGHAANCALWLDAKTGNWASSTYFKEMPVAVSTRNRATPLASRLDTMSWAPSTPTGQYPYLPEHLCKYPFRHVFPRGNAARLDMFAASPMANREVTEVASDLLGTLRIGNHPGVTDVLNVAFNATPYTYGKNPDNRPEIYDTYLRLDRNLEQLFAAVSRQVGMDSTVVLLTATPPRPRNRRDDERWGIPYGEFSTRKAASLLNIYLMALYGNGDFVQAYHNGQFYLNRKTIKDLGLDERAVRSEAAHFLGRMTGVDRAYTLDEILAGQAGDNAEALRRNTWREAAGDILVDIQPGFETIDDYNTSAAPDQGGIHRAAPATAIAFILAPGLPAQTIGYPVDARAIAPTVASILRIRSPNGASVAPLDLKGK